MVERFISSRSVNSRSSTQVNMMIRPCVRIQLGAPVTNEHLSCEVCTVVTGPGVRRAATHLVWLTFSALRPLGG